MKEKRKNVGAYALIGLGLILAMGFAPMNGGMAATSSTPTTDVMEDVLIESYDGDLFIVISGVDLGDFNGIAALVMDNISIDGLENIMEYLGLSEYIPYVMEDVLIESLPQTVVLVLEDKDIAGMDANATVPLFIAQVDIGAQGIEITPLVMEDVLIENIPNIVPYVMEDIPIE